MTGALDLPLRSMAQTLLNVLGGTATLRKEIYTTDPMTDVTTTAVQELTIAISPPEPYSAQRVDGTLVLAGDAKTIVSALDLEAGSAADFVLPPGSLENVYLTIGSTRWTVVRSVEIRSGNLVAAVELQLRR